METIVSLILIAVAYCVFTKTKDTHKYIAAFAFATVMTLAVMIANVTAVPLVATVLVGMFYAVGGSNKSDEDVRNVVFYVLLVAAAGIVYYPQIITLF